VRTSRSPAKTTQIAISPRALVAQHVAAALALPPPFTVCFLANTTLFQIVIGKLVHNWFFTRHACRHPALWL